MGPDHAYVGKKQSQCWRAAAVRSGGGILGLAAIFAASGTMDFLAVVSSSGETMGFLAVV